MTAAKIMEIISRLPGCDGQAADAVSAYTQVKTGRCSRIVENSQIGMSRHLDSSTTTQMAKMIVQYGRSSRSSSLKMNLYGHPLAGLLCERQFEKILLKHGWEKIPNWECLSVHREKDYSSLCMWMT